MKKRIVLLSLLSVIAVTSTIGQAGNRPCAVTFSIGDAYYHFAAKRKIEYTWLPNLAVGYNFDRHLGIEASIGQVNTNTTKANATPKQGVHGYLYMIDGLYHFNPYQNLEPYVAAGIGVLSIRPNGVDSEKQGNINAGLGLQYFVASSIAFRAEARDVYTLTGGKNDYMLNLGMSFLFGPGPVCM